MAKISVVVPVYKVEPYLRRCVDSILAQTYRDFELILVDDGSPDRCGEICDEYGKRDNRVVVIHQDNGGLSAARNSGIDWSFANSNSEYLSFVDSDDWVVPNYFEALLCGAELSGGVSCCACQEFQETNYVASAVATIDWQCVDTREYWLQVGYTMTAWGKLYPKRLFVGLRYPVGKIHEDEYITHRVLFQCIQLAQTDAKLYCYYRRPDSITKNSTASNRLDYIKGIEDQYALFDSMNDLELMEMVAGRLVRGYCEALKCTKGICYREKLRKILKRHHFSLVRHREAYRLSYPVSFFILWPGARLVDVLSRRGFVGMVKQFCGRFI